MGRLCSVLCSKAKWAGKSDLKTCRPYLFWKGRLPCAMLFGIYLGNLTFYARK